MGNYSIICIGNGASLASSCIDDGKPGEQCYFDQQVNPTTSKWRVVPAQGQLVGKGYAILFASQNYCLDAKGGLLFDKTAIITWLNEGKPNQTWNIIPV